MTPSIQQRMAELRIQQLHAEAAHARLVKEARAARRSERGSSRLSRLVAGFRAPVAEQQPGTVTTVRSVGRRAAAKTVPC
jgi:hypothetical protein